MFFLLPLMCLGFKLVENIDFSEHVIGRMNKQIKDTTPPSVQFKAIDICEPLPYDPLSFQLILDKGKLLV